MRSSEGAAVLAPAAAEPGLDHPSQPAGWGRNRNLQAPGRLGLSLLACVCGRASSFGQSVLKSAERPERTKVSEPLRRVHHLSGRPPRGQMDSASAHHTVPFLHMFLAGEIACYVALLLHGLAAMDAFAVSSTVGGARGAMEVSEHKMPPPQQQTGEVLWAAARPGDRGSGVRRCKRNCFSFIGAARACGAKRMTKNHVAPLPLPYDMDVGRAYESDDARYFVVLLL